MERMNEEEFMIPNVLADRYASTAMRRIWSREEKIRIERRLWVEIMRLQKGYGIEITEEQISSYQRNIEYIDLESIKRRERQLKHDVKARLEEFNALAGHQLIHLGMTSRDLTENVEMVQVRESLSLVRSEVVEMINLFGKRARQYQQLVVVGRSHNVPAQLTTLGKRLATIAEELLFALERMESLMERIPLRGLRGPVGTAQDIHDLVGSHSLEIDSEMARSLGFSRILDSTGQIYPRSIDFEVVSTLVQLAAGPANLALLVRLMSGAGLLSEGFKEGQIGSSAMPHKVNARLSERVTGLCVVLRGHLSMISEISGDQWNEGDVSCSVVRRVALPDAFFAFDGICATAYAVLKELEVFETPIQLEVDRELPFIASTKLMTAAIKKGMAREEAYELLKNYSLKTLESRRQGLHFDLFGALADDPNFPLTGQEIESEVRRMILVPEVETQISRILERINQVVQRLSPISHTFDGVI
jgi:adenylosuccinate lyase